MSEYRMTDNSLISKFIIYIIYLNYVPICTLGVVDNLGRKTFTNN